jgi:hypothetical protein
MRSPVANNSTTLLFLELAFFAGLTRNGFALASEVYRVIPGRKPSIFTTPVIPSEVEGSVLRHHEHAAQKPIPRLSLGMTEAGFASSRQKVDVEPI